MSPDAARPAPSPAAYAEQRVLHPPRPVDLALTVSPLRRGDRDPCLRILREGGRVRVVMTARIPETTGRGVVGVLTREASPRGPAGGTDPDALLAPVRARAWGQDPREVRAFLDAVPRMLGWEDDWSGLFALPAYAQLPHAVRDAARRRPGLRLPASGAVFKHLVSTVFEQKVTGFEAIGACHRMVRRLGEPAASDPEGAEQVPAGMMIFPAPHVWAQVPSWAWQRAGVDAQRARTVGEVARAAGRLSRAAQNGDVPLLARTMAGIPGVGPWSVAETLQRSHGLADAISVGDYHLAHHVCHALQGRRGDDARMLELLEPFRGHRQRVVRLIFAAGLVEPRRGPRVAPTKHLFGGKG